MKFNRKYDLLSEQIGDSLVPFLFTGNITLPLPENSVYAIDHSVIIVEKSRDIKVVLKKYGFKQGKLKPFEFSHFKKIFKFAKILDCRYINLAKKTQGTSFSDPREKFSYEFKTAFAPISLKAQYLMRLSVLPKKEWIDTRGRVATGLGRSGLLIKFTSFWWFQLGCSL